MRIRVLTIPRFKNLRGFTLTFADTFASVLVGPNGTGKSNLLEALAIIFRDLDLAELPKFSYHLEYELDGANVVVDAVVEPPKQLLAITVDGTKYTPKRFSRKGGGKHLPKFVFAYYSGPSERLESHFDTHQKRFADELLGGVKNPDRPFLYARLVHSQFALLSFFQREDQDREVLEKYLRIQDLDSVLFVLKRPHWHNPNRRPHKDDPGDPRFWGARGVVRRLLGRLYGLSLAPIYSERTDRWYLFLQDKHALMKLASAYKNQQEFFKALESLYISDLIDDVRTSVRVAGTDDAMYHRELSEGELQLLLVLVERHDGGVRNAAGAGLPQRGGTHAPQAVQG